MIVVIIRNANGCTIKSLSYFIKEASYEVKENKNINKRTKNSCVSFLFGNLFNV